MANNVNNNKLIVSFIYRMQKFTFVYTQYYLLITSFTSSFS